VTHVLARVHTEYPAQVSSADLSKVGNVGYDKLWVTEFDDRRLHEIVVATLVELMGHTMTHADDETAATFEQQLAGFDAAAFVDAYRD
jgi:hypothetical protein